ncbi:fimbrial protein [Salmonella enterica]|uniref:fimbrial protein n=1 Tax=Salmonella enterica TaxID=28901 RepID=UPI00107196F6|nr:type 1 fimbrial protein [Salmonella enterica]
MSVFILFTRAAWRAVFMPLCMTVLAAPGMAGAAITGTQTFKAAVTTGTCTVPGSQMTQTIDFGNIPRLKTLHGDDTDAVTVGVPVVSRDIHFNVTGCPASMYGVAMEVDFQSYSDEHPDWIRNTGSVYGLVMAVTDAWGNTQISGGALTPDAGMTGDAVTLNGAVHIYRMVRKGLVTSGTVNGQINLTLVTI